VQVAPSGGPVLAPAALATCRDHRGAQLLQVLGNRLASAHGFTSGMCIPSGPRGVRPRVRTSSSAHLTTHDGGNFARFATAFTHASNSGSRSIRTDSRRSFLVAMRKYLARVTAVDNGTHARLFSVALLTGRRVGVGWRLPGSAAEKVNGARRDGA
jgi:hypothetical protein